mmetsp:Transcript_59223/g.139613  ORF Transcript_59223/g.139613 Transcript_59223/m.139613 type:complete len:320 (+) Transcript_59223:652-1611(+)
MARPSSTALTMVMKLSSAKTILEASLATAVPVPIATPMSAALRAGASLTPSPVIAVTRPFPSSWRSLTRSCLWAGSVREKREAWATASRFSRSDMRENSSPVNDLPVRSSSGSKMPIWRQMASAVFLLSPVMTMTRMPAWWHLLMAPATSMRGGSRIPTIPTKVMLDSTWAKLAGSERSGSWAPPRGAGATARARQRSACRPPPYSSSMVLRRRRLVSSVNAAVPPPGRATRVQRWRMPSGAPLTTSSRAPVAVGVVEERIWERVRGPSPRAAESGAAEGSPMSTDMDLRSRANSRVAMEACLDRQYSSAGVREPRGGA